MWIVGSSGAPVQWVATGTGTRTACVQDCFKHVQDSFPVAIWARRCKKRVGVKFWMESRNDVIGPRTSPSELVRLEQVQKVSNRDKDGQNFGLALVGG